MKRRIKNLLKAILAKTGYSIIESQFAESSAKYNEETAHWRRSFKDYQAWYNGEVDQLYGENPPEDRIKVKDYDQATNALLTWQAVHQRPKYLRYLKLGEDSFSGMKVLDIGSGPHPSALAFKNCNLFCLDPLFPEYMRIGFPFHLYEERVRFVYGFSEKLPFPDNYFDTVISVNALDHVDDFENTAEEIGRVLKPNGKIRMQLHYHTETPTEPLELNDARVSKAFQWCKNLKKIDETEEIPVGRLSDPGESLTLWSNF